MNRLLKKKYVIFFEFDMKEDQFVHLKGK